MHAINQMENAMAYRMVICEFTTRNVMDWLWPQDLIERLERAARETSETISSYKCEFQVNVGDPGTIVDFFINCVNLKILPPLMSPVPYPMSPWHSPIMAALNDLQQVYSDYNVVRTVIAWLNGNRVTPGAALEMFPSIRPLLPPNHPIHQLQGQRRREPEFYPDAEMTQYMRQGQAIVSAGLLADPQSVKVTRTMLGVTLKKTSQRFMLL